MILRKTIAALVAGLLADYRDDLSMPSNSEHVHSFVCSQLRHMASPLAVLVQIATWALAVMCVLKRGGPLHRLNASDRVSVVRTWKASRVKPIRDTIRFYESLAIFAYHSTETR